MKSTNKGFTLIELLVVIGVIIILSKLNQLFPNILCIDNISFDKYAKNAPLFSFSKYSGFTFCKWLITLFLKYVSDAFEERRKELLGQFKDQDHEYYLGERWDKNE